MTDVAVKVIAAIGTTAGFVTIVAGTGGAVTWMTLRAAGLPANQGLVLATRKELVGAGAIALGAFLVLGAVAVATVYGIDHAGRATDNMRVGLSALVAVEVVVVIFLVTDADDWERWVGSAWSAILFLIARVVKATDLPFRARKTIPPSSRALQDAKELQQLGYGDGMAPTTVHRDMKGLTLLLAAATCALTAGWFFLLYDSNVVGYSVLAAGALAGLCFAVAESSRDQFWPYAVAVFFSVALFGGFVAVIRIEQTPKLSPVALVRRTHDGVSGVIGLLVARTGDRYWLGVAAPRCHGSKPTTQGDQGHGRLFSVPRREVLDDEVGAPVALPIADKQARKLLAELVRRRGDPPAAAEPRTAAVDSCPKA